jgi:hypothetical protein
MRRFILLLPLLLAACQTGPSLQTRMISFMGASENTLIQSLGVPDRQITVGGINYLAYVRSRTQVLSTGGPFWGGPWGGWGPYGGWSGPVSSSVVVWSCETTFAVQDGRVVNVSFKGNDCN